MKPITITEAKERGLVAFTNPFRVETEHDLLTKMFADISERYPGAEVVMATTKTVYIAVPKSNTYVPRTDTPRALRGDYPLIGNVVGRA